MMGRMMGGGMGSSAAAVQLKNPASPAYGKYTDAGGRATAVAAAGPTLHGTLPKA